MEVVRFLSENRPGPRMGMGHAEKMLLQHLAPMTTALGWRLEIVFSGRAPGSNQGIAVPGVARTSFLGFSAARLRSLPFPIARAATRIGSGLSAPSLYHSLALSYPMPKCAPAIYTIHDLPPARFPDEGNLPVWSRQAAQTAEVIITPSQFAKEEVVDVLKVPPGRVHVIPNGVEHELFGPTTHEATEQQLAGHGLSKPFVIYAGGFTRRKNVPALLAAWHKVSAEHPNLSLALVGPGSQLQKLCEEVDAPRTVIVGHLGRSEIASLMKAATAVVVPSVYEGFGLPALEGMALGVPVMAVRAGAIPEVVGDAALLVEDGSPEILAEGLLTILKDSTLAATLRRDGPIRARQFSWEKQARAVLDVYQRVLS